MAPGFDQQRIQRPRVVRTIPEFSLDHSQPLQPGVVAQVRLELLRRAGSREHYRQNGENRPSRGQEQIQTQGGFGISAAVG